MAVVRIEGQGASEDAARAALDAPRAELNRALGELGVADKDRIKLPQTEEVSMTQDVVDAAVAACAPKKCKPRKGQEPMVAPPSPRRLYLFSPAPWTLASLESARAKLGGPR